MWLKSRTSPTPAVKNSPTHDHRSQAIHWPHSWNSSGLQLGCLLWEAAAPSCLQDQGENQGSPTPLQYAFKYTSSVSQIFLIFLSGFKQLNKKVQFLRGKEIKLQGCLLGGKHGGETLCKILEYDLILFIVCFSNEGVGRKERALHLLFCFCEETVRVLEPEIYNQHCPILRVDTFSSYQSNTNQVFS